MFLPNQTTRLAWISKSMRGTGQPAADIDQPQRSASPWVIEKQQSVRSMALTVGFALLLLVLALVALATGASANPHAAVAPPPVFCEPAIQAISTTETDVDVQPATNRPRVMCVQPHSRDNSP
jgi:hypothetical protein